MASERLGVLEPPNRRGLPPTRFIDRVIVHYPGIELVADADLSASSDPYLADHLLDGDLRLPAVLGMEVFFQGKRFQRVLDYRRLAATSCVVEISAVPVNGWFSGCHPATLLLGDPGTRDAFMHAIQCCVPNATLLPTGVERLYPAAPSAAGERVTLHAVERSRVGDTYTYDLDIRDAGGAVVERWEGLRLEAVRRADGSGPWVPALLGPYLVCSAVESLRKTGRVVPEALTLHPDGRNGWVLFRAGRCKIATFATRLRGEPDPLIFAIQTEGDGNESVLRVPARREFRRDQPGGKRLLRELRALAGQVPRDVPA